MLKLSWFSPQVTDAIIEGKLSDRFGRKHLLEMAVPASWSDQHKLFGLAYFLHASKNPAPAH